MTDDSSSSKERLGRFDDANLDFLQEETHLVGSAFNEFETTVNGNLLFNPSESLRTMDWHRWGNLLQFYQPDECTPGPLQVLHNDDDSSSTAFLGVVDGLLTAEEVDQIRSNDWKRQHFHYNRGDRVIAIDQEFATLLWYRLQATISDLPSHVSQPLGFGVSGTSWKIDGVNPAMRINTYRNTEAFEAHRDAQFCESRRRRSVLSLIIYLSDTQGGETRFYSTEATKDLPLDPLTIEEEMEFYEKHSAELKEIDVKPVAGRCVLFSHGFVHESLPVAPGSSSSRIVLRSDVIATAETEPYFTDRQEVDDYRKAIALFTEAEQLELKAANFRIERVKEYDPVDESYYHGNQFLEYQDEVRFMNEHCNKYYSKSLYLRYKYPRQLKSRTTDNFTSEEFWIGIGQAALHVMEFLPMQEAIQLSVVYPVLKPILEALEARLNEEAAEFSAAAETEMKCLGKDSRTNRYYLDFSVRSEKSFHENIDAWCRVAAVLVAYKVSHSSSSERPVYCARFLPQTGQVVALSLERLIFDAFHKRKSYGVIYAIQQQQQEASLLADFEASVERGVILRDHGLEFVGQNVSEHFCVDVEPGPSTVRRRLNCVDGMLGCFPTKHETNIVSASKRPGRHIFVNVDTKSDSMRYGVTHMTEGSWRLTQHSVSPRKYCMNQMIFDFERYKFEVHRKASWEGIEYIVDISEMMKDIEPFYHASTSHEASPRHATIYRGRGSMKLKYLACGGTESPFLDRSGSPSELRVKPTKKEQTMWDVRVEWSGSFFPVTL